MLLLLNFLSKFVFKYLLAGSLCFDLDVEVLVLHFKHFDLKLPFFMISSSSLEGTVTCEDGVSGSPVSLLFIKQCILSLSECVVLFHLLLVAKATLVFSGLFSVKLNQIVKVRLLGSFVLVLQSADFIVEHLPGLLGLLAHSFDLILVVVVLVDVGIVGLDHLLTHELVGLLLGIEHELFTHGL